MKLWKIGILTVILGGLINAILIQNHIGGFPREGMRLVILIGVFVFLFGSIRAFRRK